MYRNIPVQKKYIMLVLLQNLTFVLVYTLS